MPFVIVSFVKLAIFFSMLWFLFAYIHTAQSFTAVVLYIIIVIATVPFHVLMHELGHFIGGLFSDYHFLSLHFFALGLKKSKEDKFQIFLDGEIYSQCVMIPNKSKKKKFLLYNLSGIIANVLVSIIALYLLSLDNSYVLFLGKMLILSGIAIVTTNAIPVNHKMPNDMRIVMWLIKSRNMRSDYFRYLEKYEIYFYSDILSNCNCADSPEDGMTIVPKIEGSDDFNYNPFFAKEINKLSYSISSSLDELK